MKGEAAMYDDLVPEESRQEYRPLMTALRPSPQRRETITAAEQAQIVTRVRERLEEAMSTSTVANMDALPSRGQFVPRPPARQMKPSRRIVANLLAAIVVIGLILGSLALFKVFPTSKKAAVSPTVTAAGSGPIAQTQANGLQASMRVLIGGPYFLGELLPVDVSLTNHTQKAVVLDGTNRTATLCFQSALFAQVTQGNGPFFTIPKLEVACTQPAFITYVQAGQTLTIHQYVPLTRSGAVTLAMKGGTFGPMTSPLDTYMHGNLPILRLQVNSQVPPNRALTLERQKGQVAIKIPAGAKPRLLYMQSISCDSYLDSSSDHWTPLATNVLREPSCPTAHPHWEYIISAPGYSIVYGP
jgi:hypothetical protein